MFRIQLITLAFAATQTAPAVDNPPEIGTTPPPDTTPNGYTLAEGERVAEYHFERGCTYPEVREPRVYLVVTSGQNPHSRAESDEIQERNEARKRAQEFNELLTTLGRGLAELVIKATGNGAALVGAK